MEKIYAKKSLGQNFLHAPHIVNKMVHTANITEGMTVLEIGPGKAVLTEKLLESVAVLNNSSVVAVEKDDRMIPFLQEKFSAEIANGKLELLHGDVLDPSFVMKKTPYAIVANIPYYITGEILRTFLECDTPPQKMVLMVQREVAQRIVARENGKESKESILSISVKVFGNPKYIETVPARFFKPEPNVDSAVILIENISDRLFRDRKIDKKLFFVVLKTGFAHKRKVLFGNLSALEGRIPNFSKEKLLEIWEKCGLDKKVRAEELSVDTWINIVSGLIS